MSDKGGEGALQSALYCLHLGSVWAILSLHGADQTWIMEVLLIGMILSKILDVDTTLDYSLGTYPLYWHKFGPSNEKNSATKVGILS